MTLELLNLFVGAGLGTASSEAYAWFRKKAGEKNHDIQRALLTSHHKALREIHDYCQTLPEWNREKDQIEARLSQMDKDALEILGIVEAHREQSTTAFEISSFNAETQQQVTATLMGRLKSEDKWLKEAPSALSNAVQSLFIPIMVRQFRVELKHDEVVFRTLIHDMLAATGADVSRTLEATEGIEQRWDEFIHSFQKVVEQLNTRLDLALPVPSKFQALIADKTKGFVGREYVFAAITDFLTSQPNGYFIIEADPGAGKSAILAKYVQNTGCIAYFNEQLKGLNRVDQFLESLCIQLIDRYQLPYRPLPSNAIRDGEFLSQLLGEVAQRRDGKPVVIAIDALDEVDQTSYRDANVLYLPPHLPIGIYFVMTVRQSVEVPLTVFTPKNTFNLMGYQVDSQRDVHIYIQNCVDASETLRQHIAQRQETIPEFTGKIAEKSDSNFMYLRYVLQDIEKGLYQDLSLESFPQGLRGYYDFHWRRMGMKADPLPRAKIKIVYILGEVHQPVSRQQICDFSGEDAPTVQSVLNEWKQFLHEIYEYEQKCYSVYHVSFQDFLHRKDILENTGLTIPGIKLLIAKDQLSKWKNRRRRE